MGNSGRTNGIYHVHFEIRKTSKFLSDIDPSPIFGKEHLEQDEYFKVTSKIKNTINNQQNCSNDKLKGNNNIEKMWFFFKSKGYTDEAVAGIIGSAMAESGPELDPKMQQVGGPARGIFQWESRRKELNGNYIGASDNRFDKLYDWSISKNKDPFLIETQLLYAYLEMTNPNYDSTTYILMNEPRFKKVTSIHEATKHFTRCFERAGIEVLDKRINYAQKVYQLMKNKK